MGFFFKNQNYTMDKLIRNFNPDIKDNSLQFYIQNIQKSLEHVNVFSFEDVKKYIESHESIATQRNRLISIIVYLKASGYDTKEYSEYHNILTGIQEARYTINSKTKRETDNWVSIEDITSKMNILSSIKECTRKDLDSHQQYLVLSLYTLLPPLRNDWAMVKVTTNEDTNTNFNYINTDKKKIVLNRYKTQGVYGTKVISIPKKLNDVIIQWENAKKKYFTTLDHDFLLLSTTTRKPMTSNTLTKYINKIFYPKKVSSTMLRKIYLSDKYPVVPEKEYYQRKKDSYVMGHSVDTQAKVYCKKNE